MLSVAVHKHRDVAAPFGAVGKPNMKINKTASSTLNQTIRRVSVDSAVVMALGV